MSGLVAEVAMLGHSDREVHALAPANTKKHRSMRWKGYAPQVALDGAVLYPQSTQM